MRKVLAALVLTILALLFIWLKPGNSDYRGYTPTLNEYETHQKLNFMVGTIGAYINHARIGEGLETLVVDPDLSDLASDRLQSVCIRGQFNHHEFKENWPKGLTEILARDYKTPEDTLNGWLNSPDHREAILGDHKAMGIAHIKDCIVVHLK